MACAQAMAVKESELDVGMTLILGYVMGIEAASTKVKAFPHLCPRHKVFLRRASADARARVDSAHAARESVN